MKIDLASNINKVQSVSTKNVENNGKNLKECNEVLKESTVDLQYSRPEAFTYIHYI